MKKLIAVLLLVLVASVFATGVTNYPASTNQTAYSPADIDTIMLFDNVATAAKDTFLTETNVTCGPYSLTSSDGTPMYKSLSWYAKLITGTTPTMEFRYQIMPFNRVADTTALWNVLDTLDGTGATGDLDLSTKAGKYIMFSVHNYDGTTCQIPDFFIVSLKKNLSYEVKK